MGQAKARGTFEERKARAIKRREAELKESERLYEIRKAEREKFRNEAKTSRLGAVTMAVMSASLSETME